jgi:hypothetical protein
MKTKREIMSMSKFLSLMLGCGVVAGLVLSEGARAELPIGVGDQVGAYNHSTYKWEVLTVRDLSGQKYILSNGLTYIRFDIKKLIPSHAGISVGNSVMDIYNRANVIAGVTAIMENGYFQLGVRGWYSGGNILRLTSSCFGYSKYQSVRVSGRTSDNKISYLLVAPQNKCTIVLNDGTFIAPEYLTPAAI